MDIVVRRTGHRHGSGLCRVVKLAVAAAGALDHPFIVLQDSQQLANLQFISTPFLVEGARSLIVTAGRTDAAVSLLGLAATANTLYLG